MKQAAFSLIEMLVASALLAVIMLALVTMFFQTEKAFRLGVVQSDTLAGGRAVVELLARDLQEMSPAALGTNAMLPHFFVDQAETGLAQRMAGQPDRLNLLQPFYLIKRINDEWHGVRYDFSPPDASSPIKTLHRLEFPQAGFSLTNALATMAFLQKNDALSSYEPGTGLMRGYGTVLDGVVHLTLKAYNGNGQILTNSFYAPDGSYFAHQFYHTNMPAAVEVEVGILDPKTLEKARAMNDVNRKVFLEDQAANVQLFRQRIPIRSTQ